MLNVGREVYWADQWKIKVIFTKFTRQTQSHVASGLISVSLVMKNGSPLPGMGVGEGDIFTKGNLCLAFKQKGRVESFSNIYYFSVAFS